MTYPEIGSNVSVVIDNSFVHGYLIEGFKHLALPQETLSGTVVASPKWAADHLCILNSKTKAQNIIPPHKIISINDNVVEKKPVAQDRVLIVHSSKTGEPYTVRFDGRTRRWSCTCVGYQFHRKCRHATRAAEAA